MIGHDYTNHPLAQNMKFGVVDAVDNFIINHPEWTFLALTVENYPTYVLTRAPLGGQAIALLGQLLINSSSVEIREYPSGHKFNHSVYSLGGKLVVVPSF